MTSGASIDFFDRQFKRQVREGDLQLNPFEASALPHLRGRVLDLGCGMGNLVVAAARQGCTVLAIDASSTAIDQLRHRAQAERLPIDAVRVDLRSYSITNKFDTIVSIGLLMFFDCASARRLLCDVQDNVFEGGTAIVNVLVEGTTYLDMFDASGYCLFARNELADSFAHWDVSESDWHCFDAPNSTKKVFSTVIARKRSAQPSRK